MQDNMLDEISLKLNAELPANDYIDTLYHISRVVISHRFNQPMNTIEKLIYKLYNNFFDKLDVLALLQTNPKLGIKIGYILAATNAIGARTLESNMYCQRFLNSPEIKNVERNYVEKQRFQILLSFFNENNDVIQIPSIRPGHVTSDDIELFFLAGLVKEQAIQDHYIVYLFKAKRYTELLEMLSLGGKQQALISKMGDFVDYSMLSISELICLKLLQGGIMDD